MSAKPRQPRAGGRRLRYDDMPRTVRAWVSATFGEVEVVQEHQGGMSPGCATSLRGEAGLFFVKAVGAELNEQTVGLFRHERAVLAALAAAPYRPRLLASMDDGHWIALAFEHVPGRLPDLDAPNDFARVRSVITTQIAELSPPPEGLQITDLATTAERWSRRWDEVAAQPSHFLPSWVVDRIDELGERLRRLPHRLPSSTLAHFDIRDDNVLIRDDGEVVVLDWGMARLGPSWIDVMQLCLQKSEPEVAAHWLEELIDEEHQATVTDVVVALGGSQAWNARQPSRQNLPNFASFCSDDAARLWAVATVRLQ